ncbi:MAG: organoarsenical effux MFS transporter ArsJ [Pseudomonadota bacterium]
MIYLVPAMLFVSSILMAFAVVTNLIGGWLGAKLGLNRTMNIGLALQIVALAMLLVPTQMLTVAWVMSAQALSGIAKDLNKMSAKSSVKLLIPDTQQGRLFTWVAALTGSKNALKGIGFFLGGALLAWIGFANAITVMMISLTVVWVFSMMNLRKDLGRTKADPKFSQLFSKSGPINALSAARMMLFGARDIWFVVALPVYFSSELGWAHSTTGAFFAVWIIAYGLVQSITPKLFDLTGDRVPVGKDLVFWVAILTAITTGITGIFFLQIALPISLIAGLLVFGTVFAINSALHSYLIVSYASTEQVSMDVGFYYMANAMGRLIGTVLSGYIYQQSGLLACLAGSCVMLLSSLVMSQTLPGKQKEPVNF